MNVYAKAPPTMDNYINKLSLLYVEQRNYLSGLLVGSYLIIFSLANREDPNHAGF